MLKSLPSAEPPSRCVAKIEINKEDIEELVAEKVEKIKEMLKSQPERKKGKWIPIWPEDPNTFPPVDKEGYSDYVLLSFSNCSVPIIGQYRVDEDGGAFYTGDDEEPLTVYDLYVNAWQPLPSPYQPKEDES